jgi:hypothetical protein
VVCADRLSSSAANSPDLRGRAPLGLPLENRSADTLICEHTLHEEIMTHPTRLSWTAGDLEKLEKLIDGGASAVRAAAALGRKITVVQSKARSIGKPFPTMRETRKMLFPGPRGKSALWQY